jgi:hypothetical protein
MGRKPKLYIPLTVTFFDDDRIIEAGDGPTLLYVAFLLRAKALGSDGRLTEAQISRLHRTRWKAELRRLAELELLIQDENTKEWCVPSWFAHNEAMSEVDARRAADRERKAAEAAERKAADSSRIPAGNVPDSALKERKGKEREGKEQEASGRLHAFEHDGDGNCSRCRLPHDSRFHLRVVEEAS